MQLTQSAMFVALLVGAFAHVSLAEQAGPPPPSKNVPKNDLIKSKAGQASRGADSPGPTVRKTRPIGSFTPSPSTQKISDRVSEKDLEFIRQLEQSRDTEAESASTRPRKHSEFQRRALLVGVNRYDKRGFSELAFAERDAAELGKELTTLGFDKVTVLQGSGKDLLRATKENIIRELGVLLKDIKKDDVVMVSLSGHGQQLEFETAEGEKTPDNFYCPVDGVRDTPESLLSLSFLIDDVLAKRGGQNLVIVDACRDEPADPGRGSRGVQGNTVSLPEDTAVFFSCRARQQSFESDKVKHGIFTYCLLDALRTNGARGGELDWTTVVQHVERKMASKEVQGYLPAGRVQKPIQASNLSRTLLAE